ncbi:LysR family transcriptional regulator [Poseidonocella sp. HB161398]|uniref:LysR family transcriptional regulator n=1 Tax=Poseidonocella sp. HB161398 TaxID=2320855 RepID=UPI001109CD11|nr:LysR family transcriptional regulator [Poseidonocella sp. HB161398]
MSRLPLFRAMEAFEAVGRTGSVAAAAAELSVSPGAVSQQLKRLEAHLGVQLVERRGRGLALTGWGRLYLAELSRGMEILSGAGQLLAAAREDAPLVVSGLPTPTAKWLGRTLYDWAREAPELPVRLIASEEEPGEDEPLLRMVFGAAPRHGRHAELFTDLAVPACAPELAEGLERPEDLFRLPVLDIAWGPRFAPLGTPGWRSWAALHGVVLPPGLQPVLSFALTATAIDAAAAGRGVVLGQLSMMEEELASGRLVIPFRLPLQVAAPYRLSWGTAALGRPGAARLRDWLIARGRRQQARLDSWAGV